MADSSHTPGVPILVQIFIGIGSVLLAALPDIVKVLDLYVGFGAKCMSLIGSVSLLLINRYKIWESIKSLFISKPKNKEEDEKV